jgi:hypothetical protein
MYNQAKGHTFHCTTHTTTDLPFQRNILQSLVNARLHTAKDNSSRTAMQLPHVAQSIMSIILEDRSKLSEFHTIIRHGSDQRPVSIVVP